MVHPHPKVALCAAVLLTLTAVPTESLAQGRRAVRAARPPTRVVVAGGFYRPFIYDPWFYPHVPYGWYPPYAYAPAYPPDSSLRLQVSPKETEVFVDGYYAGTVDDFDGFFQRLHLERGEHEVALYLPGHRTARQMIYLQPGGTFRIRHSMETLPAGAAPEPRPAPARPRRRGAEPSQEPRP